MVWALLPVDPLPGEDKYFFFSKGTYKVGRKGCDVIISKDKGVSRVHAEICIDEMVSLDNSQSQSSNMSSKVRIKDCSKYGTFINKDMGSKEKVHEYPNKEVLLKDGDLVSFGTGNATYRFSFVPIVILNRSSDTPKLHKHLQEKILSIGAYVIQRWSPNCTHVLVDDAIPLKEEFVDAVVARKPFVSHKWVELIAGSKISTEIPSCSSYAPSLLQEGRSLTVADPKCRENCLKGYTFLLESRNQYKLKDRLQALLEVGGATIVSVEDYCADSQGLEEGARQVARVIPMGKSGTSPFSRYISLLPSVTELDLLSAVFSGQLDPSIMTSPPVLVTSSCSTDDTVVADSDTEMETATSVQKSAPVFTIESSENDKDDMEKSLVESLRHESREQITIQVTENDSKDDNDITTLNSIDHEIKEEVPCTETAVKLSESGLFTGSRDISGRRTLSKLEKHEEPESGHADVIYSQNLIVRDSNFESSGGPSRHDTVLNFKRFRKMNTPSGNSFSSLVPFSKYPYRESDYGNEEVSESIKEEKERKKLEAMAEDLFNTEKGRKRGGAGSLLGIFSRK